MGYQPKQYEQDPNAIALQNYMSSQSSVNPQQNVPLNSGNISYPSSNMNMNEDMASISSLSKLLTQYEDILLLLRREFRGEVMYSYPDGTQKWIQISKPTFVVVDYKTNKPIKRKDEMNREVYIPNDEAIDEFLNILKFSGINKITPITNISENEIIDDLKEIECKVAGVLCLKQREWGIDKELLPIKMAEIKTIIKDARYAAKDGNILKALRSSVQRIEQSIEGSRDSKAPRNPYG